jgi:hypothetical protein
LDRNKVIICLTLAVIVLSSLQFASSKLACQGADEKIWYVHDAIEPTLSDVKWVEEGGIQEPASWISDGSWYQASMRQSLVGSNDIFVETYEYFNWTLVKQLAEYYYGRNFDTFESFAQFLSNEPGQWIYFSWQIDTDWYGVNFNTTKVKYTYNDATADAELWTYFHITRIPEYFVGEGRLESWLTGFDLTSVSIGSLKIWEFHKDWSKSGIVYTLRFQAPANMLSQHGENYTFAIGVSSYYEGYTFKIQQAIDINMPANTEVKEMSPANMSVQKGNTASFVIARGDEYPASYTVVSGPPAKPLGQIVWENASLWFLTPGGWAAIASLTVLTYTAMRGRRIWRRSKLYHRMYNSMVTIYDLYSGDVIRFHQEMANVSNQIFKLLIEDKVTDDQFEKLLVRRDDLLKRVQGENPRAPP